MLDALLIGGTAEVIQANAGALLGLLSVGQAATGVAGLFAGRKQADVQEELAAAAIADRRRQAKRLLGRQRVAFAKGGVDVGTGTPVDLAADTAAEEELAAQRAGLPFAVRGQRFRNEGRNALVRGVSGAATVLVANPTLRGSIFNPAPSGSGTSFNPLPGQIPPPARTP